MEENLNERKKHTSAGEEKISRKQALKKAGFMAFSAATMMMLLNKPGKAQSSDTSADPGAFPDW